MLCLEPKEMEASVVQQTKSQHEAIDSRWILRVNIRCLSSKSRSHNILCSVAAGSNIKITYMYLGVECIKYCATQLTVELLCCDYMYLNEAQHQTMARGRSIIIGLSPPYLSYL